LQTVPDNYTKAVSDTHRYKMLGNGWTIDVITHILKNISIPTTPLRVGYHKEPTDGTYIVEEIPNFDNELKHMTTKDGKAYTLTASYNGAVYWNSIEKKQRTMIPTTPLRVGTTVDKDNVVSSEEPGRYVDVYNDSKLFWRKLTPLECERLQTVPDGYTSSVSNSQRYKMLGNGWTVDVIAHIFEGMKDV
jgi:site-specific DNA-cytosine methylase